MLFLGNSLPAKIIMPIAVGNLISSWHKRSRYSFWRTTGSCLTASDESPIMIAVTAIIYKFFSESERISLILMLAITPRRKLNDCSASITGNSIRESIEPNARIGNLYFSLNKLDI